ncbi:DUF1190 domain-containing protein [Citrobacter freundii]|nr:DUF1190 domain-containing protein [Citrobacter freundii]
MARKFKSGNKSGGSGHSVNMRIDRSANPFAKERSSYSGKYLTLAIMGGAAFFLLRGCAEDGNNDNDGDGTFYSMVSKCIEDGNSATVCVDGWNNAKAEFYSSLPKQMTREACQTQFGDCYLDSTNQSWVPVFTGFLLSRVIRKDRDEQYVYNSGGYLYVSRPVWRTASGDYSWRSGSGKNDIATRHAFTTKKVSTVSRGGYGRSSSARGHWGG